MFKLVNIGVTGNMYNAISSLYYDPKSRIILQNNSTDYFDCPVGVKQGDCLSPTLFAIFINDLANEMKDSGTGVDINGLFYTTLDGAFECPKITKNKSSNI